MLAVVLGIMQVGFALHIRNTAALAAAEGARHGARADAAPGDAETRALEVLAAGSGGTMSGEVSSRIESAGGAPVVVVEISVPVPVVGPIGVGQSVTGRGRAFQESAP